METITLLNKINFPVYKLRAYNRIWEEHGIIYINTAYGKYILDNTNLPGDFFHRRWAIRKNEDPKPYNLNQRLNTREDLLLDRQKTSRVYIDYRGQIFRYNKIGFHPINCYKVESTRKIQGDRLIISLHKIPQKFTIPYCNLDINYARVIHYNKGFIFYSVLEERVKNTRIKL